MLQNFCTRHRVTSHAYACVHETVVPRLSRGRDLPVVLACWRGFPHSTSLGKRRCTSPSASDSTHTSDVDHVPNSPHPNPRCTDASVASPIADSHLLSNDHISSASHTISRMSPDSDSIPGAESVHLRTSSESISQASSDFKPTQGDCTSEQAQASPLLQSVTASTSDLEAVSTQIKSESSQLSEARAMDVSNPDLEQTPSLSSSLSSKELPRSPLAIALEPTDGSVPLWWVEHFETRR